MEVTEANLQLLAGYLQQTLSADPNVRRPAEKLLEATELQQNYPILLLNLIDKAQMDMTTRVAGAIAFKNYVKRNWAAHLDSDGPDRIHESDRNTIKTLIVTLMLHSPVALQKQLSDAVSIIGKHDFPKKWPQLIDEMVERFASGDFNVINGVLQTAHSLFKRYRFEFKSQALWEEIKFVLDRMAKPLTDLLQATMQLTKVHENNAEALKVIYGSLVLVNKVFFSLNSQDLPEFFEDNMNTWMGAFIQQLAVDVPSLRTGDDEDAGVLEHLRTQVCENICLYAKKYDEEFKPFMEQFVTAVWELLVKTSLQTKYDALVSHALQFLSVVAERQHYQSIFENPEILAQICDKVVIPNLDIRPSDEEIFEDSPEEYIRRDIEGSDIDTRRRAACDLVKTLSINFEQKIFGIFGQYLEILLTKYKENPTANWRSKDTAIYLVTSWASRGGTQKHGITQTSELVPLPEFCAQQIIPELERPNINEIPVLKAAAIKYVMVFRSILGPQVLANCLPQLIRHLPAESPVVHSYAACSVEKILTMRDASNAIVFGPQVLGPHATQLISGLFATLSLPGSGENEYVMKAIMRSFSVLQSASMPFMGVALPQLTEILTQVAKNPSRPHFNHYLFETLALSIKIVCQADASAVSSFEEALFPVFQGILQQDIVEFMPYVFQMLSVLLEVREGSGSIPEPYWALFPCLLSPALWDRTGNVTPLIRLISAFIKQGSAQIQALGKLSAILGIFQKMIASKANDHEGFYLLQNLLSYYPAAEIQTNLRQIFGLLFQRLSLSKTPKYISGIIVFFSFYVIKYSGGQLAQLIDEIQPGMFGMLLDRVFITDMGKVLKEQDRKMVAVGVTKLLTETPEMLLPQHGAFWPRLLHSLIDLFERPPEKLKGLEIGESAGVAEDPDAGYQVAFAQLTHAQPNQPDHLAEITDARQFLATSLSKFAQSRAGELPTLLSPLEPEYKQVLQKYCDQAGVRIA
ncbi:LOW QUALITY PROTEIN: exportin-2 [Drosophila gunungcola]|uniref:LOW QUALITY PROTEIN: exportin-2 n=1 Tax=Drosophila gunungcola TaxID=103775 RepID=UPI0022E4D824|nr:LOW QUALITY PROTEIN: exportin-2 [Drosophila gunungcola]